MEIICPFPTVSISQRYYQGTALLLHPGIKQGTEGIAQPFSSTPRLFSCRGTCYWCLVYLGGFAGAWSLCIFPLVSSARPELYSTAGIARWVQNPNLSIPPLTPSCTQWSPQRKSWGALWPPGRSRRKQLKSWSMMLSSYLYCSVVGQILVPQKEKLSFKPAFYKGNGLIVFPCLPSNINGRQSHFSSSLIISDMHLAALSTRICWRCPEVRRRERSSRSGFESRIYEHR